MPSTRSQLNRLLAGIAVVASGSAVFAETPVDFRTDVAPIFRQHCLRCHSAKNRQGELSVATEEDLRRHEFVIGSDPASSYLLDVVSSQDGQRPQMPKQGDPLSAKQVEILRRWIEAGAKWPEGIVIDPDPAAEGIWWSLIPPEAVHPPIFEDTPADWRENPIDAFILRELAAHQLEPSPRAGRSSLIRRVTLDLTGLPPTPEEVDAFINNSGDPEAAYEQVVDRLLDSPRYGERWAQHWLDVIRWAETVGFETNLERPNAWPYRDWVIRSLNEDKPYDQFLFEQLAGDTVGEDAALGFLVAGPANLPGQIGRDEPAMRQARQDELDEVIRTVSQGLFGLTIGCARCHDHKFDPITSHDYYALQAIFAGMTYGDRRLRGELNDEWQSQVPAAEERLAALLSERDELRQTHSLRPAVEDVHREKFEPILARSIRMEIHATHNGSPASLYEFEVFLAADAERGPLNIALASGGAKPSASGFALANQTRHFDNLVDGDIDKRQAFPWVNDQPGPAWIQVELPQPRKINHIVWHRGESVPVDYEVKARRPDSNEWIEIVHTRDRLPRIDDTRPADQIRLAEVSSEQIAVMAKNTAGVRRAQAELSRFSAGPQVFAARFTDSPEKTWLLERGDPMQRSVLIQSAVPVFLAREDDLVASASEVERRLMLARHLTRPDHPLSARVIVNRVWQHHFGTGLVDTPSDFGQMGTEPTHPELLDWLAVDFVNSGWSLKHLHRLIVTAQTYRQSSRPREEALAKDAKARLLWRFPPRRLEAEAIRDSILAVSGKLNLTMGGPGFNFFNQRGGLSDYQSLETFDQSGWRRMIYAHKVRMQAVDIFGMFDCPDAGQMKPRRTRSITPLQSLSLLNSPFVNRQAAYFAERIVSEVGKEPVAQLERAFQLVFARSPTESEQRELKTLVEHHGLEQVCRVVFNTSEFVFLR